jgi:hypothetical protein
MHDPMVVAFEIRWPVPCLAYRVPATMPRNAIARRSRQREAGDDVSVGKGYDLARPYWPPHRRGEPWCTCQHPMVSDPNCPPHGRVDRRG